ncbi:hypothetical protein FB451DRAFT_1569084 [Mycena latifolia]|nr:hypothetical protein FB451DRAFT_1569084 [Mycena latifolia]
MSSGFFANCNNFTITGGSFNLWERPASPRSEFRSIRLGDLNLLTQVGPDELLDPFFLQLFGVSEARRMNALIYHDELMTITEFRHLHAGSSLTSAYILYQMLRDYSRAIDRLKADCFPFHRESWYYSIRMSTGLLCIHEAGRQMKTDELNVVWADPEPGYALFPWDISAAPGLSDVEHRLFSKMNAYDIVTLLEPFDWLDQMAVHSEDCVPLGKLIAPVGDWFDFQVAFSHREVDKAICWARGWRTICRYITDVTEMNNTWTRLRVESVPETETNLLIDYTIEGPWRSLKRCWLSHATRLLGPWIAADNHMLNGTVLDVHLQFSQHTPQRNSPTLLPYLFLSSPRIKLDMEGRVSVIIPPQDQRYYWSFDPAGDERLCEELVAQIALPAVEFQLWARGSSWTASQYTLLRDFEEAKKASPVSVS